ncbi:hypothetical protein Taro_033785 [Colocasia esculenta]|uniref:Uncharacterized protein n=1 Tax=Colocasia esculenta TaxID=4460 RepID=A0A843W125_COLES|nr:hypothetical protein [Colocasia esculenta]
MLPSPAVCCSPVSGRFPERGSQEPPLCLEGDNACVTIFLVSLPSGGRARAGRRRRGGSVDTRDSSQNTIWPIWDSVSTLAQVVSTLEAFPEHLLGCFGTVRRH